MNRTYKQAAEELNIPQSWLEKGVAADVLPHSRYGRWVRFSDEDIAAIKAMAVRKPDIRTTPLAVLRERASQRRSAAS